LYSGVGYVNVHVAPECVREHSEIDVDINDVEHVIVIVCQMENDAVVLIHDRRGCQPHHAVDNNVQAVNETIESVDFHGIHKFVVAIT